MLSNLLIEQDRAHLIHPASPLRLHEKRGVTILQSAKGCFVTDMEGKTLLDGFAGLWCVNAGYGQESIVEVAMEQMRRLPLPITEDAVLLHAIQHTNILPEVIG